jgi:hypothetical protein
MQVSLMLVSSGIQLRHAHDGELVGWVDEDQHDHDHVVESLRAGTELVGTITWVDTSYYWDPQKTVRGMMECLSKEACVQMQQGKSLPRLKPRPWRRKDG